MGSDFPDPNRPQSEGSGANRSQPSGPRANQPAPATTPPQSAGGGSPAPSDTVAPEQLRRALEAFKKRLKLTRLDDESRLGHGAMTSGGRSGIVAIVPPARYPQAVWDELVNQGRLRRAGQGLYELAEEL